MDDIAAIGSNIMIVNNMIVKLGKHTQEIEKRKRFTISIKKFYYMVIENKKKSKIQKSKYYSQERHNIRKRAYKYLGAR